MKYVQGFSLVELMITVAVIGVIAAVAIPSYQGYLEAGRTSVLRDNIQTIRLFQENYKLENRAYVGGTYNPSSPDVAGGLKDNLGWEPRTDTDVVTYVVTCGAVSTAPRCTTSGGYYVTATHNNYPNDPLCIAFAGASCP